MHHLLDLLLLLAVIITASKVAGSLAGRIGQPSVFGELLVGLLLGPTLLDLTHWPLFSPESREALEVVVRDLAELGVILLMFLAGLETNLGEMRRVGLAASWAAVGGIVLPFLGGIWLSRAFGFGPVESVFIGTVLTATSVSISAQTLMELGKLRSKEGTTILGAAIIDDVLGIIVLSLVIAFSAGGGVSGGSGTGADGFSAAALAVIVGKMAAFFVVGWVVGRAVFERLARWVEKATVSEPVLALAVVLALVYSWAAQALGGVAAITGAYLAGLLFAQTAFKPFIEHRVQHLAYGFLVPVFFVSIGLEANARALGGSLLYAALVIVLAVAGKIVGCGAGALLARFSPLEALRVGTGMVSRGEVALIVSSVGLAAGVIGPDVFSIMVLMTLFTTLVTPVALRLVFAGGPGQAGAREAASAGGPAEGEPGAPEPVKGVLGGRTRTSSGGAPGSLDAHPARGGRH